MLLTTAAFFFLREIYASRNIDPNCSSFTEFFETEDPLSEEIPKTCEGVMSIQERERALKTLDNNKTPGTNGLTPEFYRLFLELARFFHGW